jgi:ATP-dependent Zn protease
MCCEAVEVDYYRLAIDWIPFLVFIGLLIFFMVKMSRGKYSQKNQAEFMRQYCSADLEETKKINANLERIATALERRAEK